MAGLETIPLFLLGFIGTYILILIITVLDVIRDKNYLWLLIIFFLPILGIIVYWIFGNVPSGNNKSYNNRKKSYNPFSMILVYILSIGALVISLLNTRVPTICSFEFTSNCFEYYYPSLFLFLGGFIIGWILTSLWRASR